MEKRRIAHINQKTITYHTRDTVSALRLAKLLRSINEWREKNEGDRTPSVQRKVKAIQATLNQSEGK